MILGLIAIGVFVVIVSVYSANNSSNGSASQSAASDQTTRTVVTAETKPAVSSQSESQSRKSTPESVDVRPPAPVASEIDPDIETSIRSTLDSGHAARWHSADGHSGYAVASQAQSYGTKECRTYQVTEARGPFHTDKLIPDGLACREGPDGPWDLHATLPASG
jgi:hypothetical protein